MLTSLLIARCAVECSIMTFAESTAHPGHLEHVAVCNQHICDFGASGASSSLNFEQSSSGPSARMEELSILA